MFLNHKWSALTTFCIACLVTLSSAEAQWGTVKGKILVDGTIKPSYEFMKGDTKIKDPDVCSKEDFPKENVIVDAATGGLANVVIYLKKKPAKVHPSLEKPADPEVVFDQKGCRFMPHILVVQVGQTVIVKSDDPVAHNTRGTPVRNTGFNFTVGANDRVGSKVELKMTEKNPFPVSCDFHNWMRAHWLVVDHPYHAVTAADGSFEIKDLPVGEHDIIIWQEQVGYLVKNVKWKVADGANTIDTIKVPAAQLTAK